MGRKAPRGPKTLFDKVKDIDPYFAEESYSATDERLHEKLANGAKEATTLENAMSKDVDLKSLREQAKTAAETYTVPLKAIKLKRQFIYKILEERGKAP